MVLAVHGKQKQEAQTFVPAIESGLIQTATFGLKLEGTQSQRNQDDLRARCKLVLIPEITSDKTGSDVTRHVMAAV
ncbi:hypothetical protein RRG08_034152 [Elysia crispata]|uniref:Uncharacterized protein n=1 Tax=Elysia crispata TaxID=231223 RepID=A0AAE1DHV2_9GAST|nr:hypothetical protein RRG08_034152 [Elysia crispata]